MNIDKTISKDNLKSFNEQDNSQNPRCSCELRDGSPLSLVYNSVYQTNTLSNRQCYIQAYYQKG